MVFGLHGVDDRVSDFSLLMRVLRETKVTDQISAKSILYQAYETTFGIHDHLKQAMDESVMTDPTKKRPLSSVALHFAEDHSSTSRLFQMFDLYMDKNIHGYTGLSWLDFMSLPHDQCEHILERCAKRRERESAVEAQGIAALQRTGPAG